MLLPPPVDYGSDMEAFPDEEDSPPDPAAAIDRKVDKIWRLFFIDILELSPNQ